MALDDVDGVRQAVRAARAAIGLAHNKATEDDGLNGPWRDVFYGIGTELDAIDQIIEEAHGNRPPPEPLRVVPNG